MINICIPHIVIEPIAGKLSTRVWLSTTQKEQQDNIKLWLKRFKMNVEVVAQLGKTKLPVKEFINLKAERNSDRQKYQK